MKTENTVFIIFAVLSVFVLIALVGLIGTFIIKFNKKTRFIIGKMNSALDDANYINWQKELRCHYLCLIPFVNKRNVLNVYSFIYYKPKHKLATQRTDGVWHILAPSLLGFCVCAICLCGTSWAWFTATRTSGVASITAATYTVNIAVKENGAEKAPTENDGGFVISLDGDKDYEISITANGTAKSGYCTVKWGDKAYYTEPILKGNDAFVVNVKDLSGDLTITTHWGSCTETDNIIASGTTIAENGEVVNAYGTNVVINIPQPITDTPETETDIAGVS